MNDNSNLRKLLSEDLPVCPCPDLSAYINPVTVAFADEVEQQVKDDMVSVCKKFGVSIEESQVFDILQGGERTYNEGYKAGLNDLINILNSEKELLAAIGYDFSAYFVAHIIEECKELLDRRGI